MFGCRRLKTSSLRPPLNLEEMILSLIVITILILVEIGVFFLFRKNANRAHFNRLKELQEKINLNKKQVLQRENQLLVYNFLKYNLTQSLVSQKNVY